MNVICMYSTSLISPASGVALFATRQHLLLGGKAGIRDLITGYHLSVQPDQGNVKLHCGHCGILESLVAIDTGHIETALTRLRVSQVVLAKAHAPALQPISESGWQINESIIIMPQTLQ